MINQFCKLLFSVILFWSTYAQAQDSTTCKVLMETLKGTYTGECKNGYANGKGEATGLCHYTGLFKNGQPNGKGLLDYGDHYYDGLFLDGKKEGKGEMHYLKDGTDSVIKGYWSGDEYRGKSYVTYKTDAVAKFDRFELNPGNLSGNRLTIEVSTTSNDPDHPMLGSKPSIGLSDLIAMKVNQRVEFISHSESPLKYSWTFRLSDFPITLRAVLSNGQDFNLELYKATDWNLRIYINR